MGWPTSEQRRNYERNKYRTRREAFFADKACVRCGATKDLQLDHINPKDKTTHRIWHWPEERRLAEIEKCQVLCKSCHQGKSIKEDWPILRGYQYSEHGAPGYRRGCRCATCKEGARDRMREYRARKKAESSEG